MRVSRAKVGANRERIVATAGKLFRLHGFEAVTVAEVMQAAGLTHGAFYGYFASKADLIVAVAEDMAIAQRHAEDPSEIVDCYLSVAHRDDRGEGCPVAALGGEIIRHEAAARDAMTRIIQLQVDTLAKSGSSATRTAAIRRYSEMLGALIISRISTDPAFSEEVLEASRICNVGEAVRRARS